MTHEWRDGVHTEISFSAKKKVIFTAGGFDSFHHGHQRFLERAKALGDYLIVGINYDAHFKRKGPNRPLDTAEVRKQKLYQSGLVDEVVEFGESPVELLKLIKFLKPDVIAVCDEYDVDSTVGGRECQAWGGRVHIMPRTPGISTTQIVKEKIS